MTEGTLRPPHVRRFESSKGILEYQTDERGFISISEELLEALLLEIGFISTDAEPDEKAEEAGAP